jgi:DNA-binding NarL/FixJ family response regulator
MSNKQNRNVQNEQKMIGVVIADDHEMVLRGLRMTINSETDMELLGEARNGNQAVELAREMKPDVILVDLQMPELDGIQAANIIHDQNPDIAILVLTSFGDDSQLFSAMRAGISGYLLKDMDGEELVNAIRGAVRGEPQLHPDIARRLMERVPLPSDPFKDLTSREKDVLILIARGFSNKEIGQALSLTEATVKGYVSAILSKLNISDRTQAALIAVRYGLINQDDLPDMGSL